MAVDLLVLPKGTCELALSMQDFEDRGDKQPQLNLRVRHEWRRQQCLERHEPVLVAHALLVKLGARDEHLLLPLETDRHLEVAGAQVRVGLVQRDFARVRPRRRWLLLALALHLLLALS